MHDNVDFLVLLFSGNFRTFFCKIQLKITISHGNKIVHILKVKRTRNPTFSVYFFLFCIIGIYTIQKNKSGGYFTRRLILKLPACKILFLHLCEGVD